MKRILSVLAVGILSVGAAAAQTSVSAQTDASAQSQTSMQANKSGAQASGKDSAATSTSASASSPAKTGNSSMSVSSGTKIDATLVSSLDAKRNKAGDRVEARTTQDVKQDGKVVWKKGTRLLGHVTQVKAQAKGEAPSQLGIAFDHAVLHNGQEMPFGATIQALAIAESSATANAASDSMMTSDGAMGGMSGMSRGGGGLVGGVASTAGASAGSVMNTAGPVSSTTGGTLSGAARSAGAVGGLTSSGQLTSNSSGVFGLQGVSIDSAASNATQGSMIVSSTKNVRLESGTQMLLSASGQAK